MKPANIILVILSVLLLSAQEHKNFKRIGKPVVICDSIPKRINESSGLIYFRNKLWTHNDSGDGPYIYVIDTTGKKMLQVITVENATNIDWEEISQDAGHIYACDFGNNYGHRNHCTIYQIKKTDIPDTGNATVKAEKIEFTYVNLPKPNTNMQRSSFDCEAMVCYHDTLVLFSKNWEGPFCNIYFIPAKPGNYNIVPNQRIYIDGLVTAASLSPDQTKVAILGYRNFTPFVYVLNNFSLQNITLTKSAFSFWEKYMGFQTEGIAFISENRAMISCEYNKYRPGTLFKIHFH